MERRGLAIVVGEEEMRVRRICCRQNGPTLVAGKGHAAIARPPLGIGRNNCKRGHKVVQYLSHSPVIPLDDHVCSGTVVFKRRRLMYPRGLMVWLLTRFLAPIIVPQRVNAHNSSKPDGIFSALQLHYSCCLSVFWEDLVC